jgi:hypothetical protein
MSRKKIALNAAWLLPVCFIVAAVGSHLAFGQRPAPPGAVDEKAPLADPPREQPKAISAEPPAKDGDSLDQKRKELLRKRLEFAQAAYRGNLQRMKVDPNFVLSNLLSWSERYFEAELELANVNDERREAMKEYFIRTREVENMVALMQKQGLGIKADVDAASYYRVDAELRLVKEGVDPATIKQPEGKTGKK